MRHNLCAKSIKFPATNFSSSASFSRIPPDHSEVLLFFPPRAHKDRIALRFYFCSFWSRRNSSSPWMLLNEAAPMIPPNDWTSFENFLSNRPDPLFCRNRPQRKLRKTQEEGTWRNRNGLEHLRSCQLNQWQYYIYKMHPRLKKGCPLGCPIGYSLGWPGGWLVGCPDGWPVGCPLSWPYGWPEGWALGCPRWLFSWLVRWVPSMFDL